MIDSLLKWLVTRVERRLGVRLSYLRHMAREAPRALIPLGLSMPASNYGRTVPPRVLHMTRLGATLAQDCGECVQIAVNVATDDGVPPSDLQAAATGELARLDPAQREALEFGKRLAAREDPEDLRDNLRSRYGERGLIEASMAVATSHLFPVLKRGMGFGHRCRVEELDFPGLPESDDGPHDSEVVRSTDPEALTSRG